MRNRKNIDATNKSATIRSRRDRTGKLRTETTGRTERSFNAAVSTDERANSTNLYLDFNPDFFGRPDTTVELNGRQARTLYRLLSKHYGFTGKTVIGF
jgi:hypothetical protein